VLVVMFTTAAVMIMVMMGAMVMATTVAIMIVVMAFSMGLGHQLNAI